MAGLANAVAAALRLFLQLSSNGELPIVKPTKKSDYDYPARNGMSEP